MRVYEVGTRVVCWEDGSHGTITELVANDCSGEPFVWNVKDDDGTNWIAFEGDFYLED